MYHVKDGDAAGNFLKLFLWQKYRIGTVRITNRGDCCEDRIVGTKVSVYDTGEGKEVKLCGDITGNLLLFQCLSRYFS